MCPFWLPLYLYTMTHGYEALVYTILKGEWWISLCYLPTGSLNHCSLGDPPLISNVLNVKHNLGIGILSFQINIILKWTSGDLVDGELGVVQQATSSVRAAHYYVIKWEHFPHYWPFVRGIHRSPVDSPHKGQWRGALVFFLSVPEQTVEQTIETPVIWDAIALIGYDVTVMRQQLKHYAKHCWAWSSICTSFIFD